MSASTASRCTLAPLDEGPCDWNAVRGTRHHTLLNSNEEPLESELDFIHSELSKTSECLAHLDDEESRLWDRLLQLEDEKALLSNYHAQNRGVVSPLRRMPPEVLAEIFRWTLPSELINNAMDSPFDVTASPWVLTHVSSLWRRVAVSTPFLWSRVAICSPHCSHPSARPMLKSQIQRAQKLKVHFFWSENEDTHQQTELFRLLSRHSFRWERLALVLTPTLVPLLSALHDQVPSLTTLLIQWEIRESQTGVGSVDCFRSAPSLVDVAIYNDPHHVPVFLPGHQLTRYELDGSWEAHWGIMALSPNLVEVHIHIGFDDEPWPETGDMVNLPCLRHLFVSSPIALDYLIAPALEEIAIETPNCHRSDFLPCLQSFLVRSACVIRRLCLVGYAPPSAITEILRKHSSVLALMVIIHEAGVKTAQQISDLNTVISQLTISPNSLDAVIAPQLLEISLGCGNKTSINHPPYLKMLRSRWENQDCTLRAAMLLTESSRPDISTLSGLEALRRDGLDLLLLEGSDALRVMDSWTYKTNAETWT
ncbi:hypothetical protein B0H11DRAFT_2063165, partial [Mycena galericulata]